MYRPPLGSTDMPLGPKGYLTMAVRSPPFLQMAIDMALSLRERSRLPVALATDAALEEEARRHVPQVFHGVTRVEERFLRRRAMKFGAARASPFEEAVFIDADCLVLADPDGLFQQAGSGPLTLTGEVLTRENRGYHHGFPTREIMDRLGISQYFKCHSGVFHLRRTGAIPLLEECLETYEREVLPLSSRLRPWRFVGDELAFGVVGGRRGFHSFPWPPPVFWPDEMRRLGREAIPRPILHFIGPLTSGFFQELMADVRRRRREVGLPPALSEPLWRREARVAGFHWRLGALHRALVAAAGIK